MVLREFVQEPEVDYLFTYVPPLSASSIRVLAALAVKSDIKLSLSDIRQVLALALLQKKCT